MNLKEAVFQNLNNSLENGHKELLEWSLEEIAEDIQNYASDMEDISKIELFPHILDWLEEQEIAKAERG